MDKPANDQMIKDQIIKDISIKLKADIIMYSGSITEAGAQQLIDVSKEPSNKNVMFCLCTFGGDANAAFKIARALQDRYEKFYLYVYGYCKSAGTLIAIGSDEIIMSDYAEFGPLDVQLQEKDELNKYSSGLNINEALSIIENRTIHVFRSMLVELVGSARLSTKMAAELATKLAIGFYAPLVSQVDPVRVGEIQRAIRIALAYGERLILKRGNLSGSAALAQLVQGYPDHGFVIDFEEAKQIFKSVRKNDELEKSLGGNIAELKYPAEEVTIRIINKGEPNEKSHKRSDADGVKQGDTKTRKANSRSGGKILPINQADSSSN